MEKVKIGMAKKGKVRPKGRKHVRNNSGVDLTSKVNVLSRLLFLPDNFNHFLLKDAAGLKYKDISNIDIFSDLSFSS